MLRTITAMLKRITQDKSYIGRVIKRFDFLGFHCRPIGATVSDNLVATGRDQKSPIIRLYEQSAPKERVGAYLRRQIGWVIVWMSIIWVNNVFAECQVDATKMKYASEHLGVGKMGAWRHTVLDLCPKMTGKDEAWCVNHVACFCQLVKDSDGLKDILCPGDDYVFGTEMHYFLYGHRKNWVEMPGVKKVVEEDIAAGKFFASRITLAYDTAVEEKLGKSRKEANTGGDGVILPRSESGKFDPRAKVGGLIVRKVIEDGQLYEVSSTDKEKTICIEGNCDNGYGKKVYVDFYEYNDRVMFYHGLFKDGKRHGLGALLYCIWKPTIVYPIDGVWDADRFTDESQLPWMVNKGGAYDPDLALQDEKNAFLDRIKYLGFDGKNGFREFQIYHGLQPSNFYYKTLNKYLELTPHVYSTTASNCIAGDCENGYGTSIGKNPLVFANRATLLGDLMKDMQSALKETEGNFFRRAGEFKNGHFVNGVAMYVKGGMTIGEHVYIQVNAFSAAERPSENALVIPAPPEYRKGMGIGMDQVLKGLIAGGVLLYGTGMASVAIQVGLAKAFGLDISGQGDYSGSPSPSTPSPSGGSGTMNPSASGGQTASGSSRPGNTETTVTREKDYGDEIRYSIKCSSGRETEVKYLKSSGKYYCVGFGASNEGYSTRETAINIACKYAN